MKNKSILIVSGSPKKNGNTAALIEWAAQAARAAGAVVEPVNIALFKGLLSGCLSCRVCQKRREYGCAVKDGISPVLEKMITANVIVMATPLYFFAASSQLKMVFDRMFSLYKWDNDAGTMKTVLKGKTLAVIASGYEDIGFDALEKPFILTAEYTGMNYASLIVPNAGVSGDVRKVPGVRENAAAFGKKIAGY